MDYPIMSGDERKRLATGVKNSGILKVEAGQRLFFKSEPKALSGPVLFEVTGHCLNTSPECTLWGQPFGCLNLV